MDEHGKYRLKPDAVEAVPCSEVLHCAQRDWYALPQWIIDAYEGKNTAGVRTLVFTNEGTHICAIDGSILAEPNDWIVHSAETDEIFPLSAEWFFELYEPWEGFREAVDRDDIRCSHRELCRLCHAESAVGFHVPDHVWEAATHESQRHDILCLACFARLADARLVWWDQDITFYPVSLRTHLESVGFKRVPDEDEQ